MGLEKLIPEILHITLVDDLHRSELAYTIADGKSDESSGHERQVVTDSLRPVMRLQRCSAGVWGEGSSQITLYELGAQQRHV